MHECQVPMRSPTKEEQWPSKDNPRKTVRSVDTAHTAHLLLSPPAQPGQEIDPYT